MEILKFYMLYVPLGIVSTILIIMMLKKKSHQEIYRFLIVLSIITIVLHLIKPFFFPYNSKDPSLEGIISFPSILRKITFENVCAVSALVYLPILLTKNKIALDYISIIGLLGGFLAFMYPTEVILGQFDSVDVTYKLGLFSFDTIRFYLVHYLIFLVPFLLLFFKIHTFDLKRAWFLSLSILTMMGIVLLNEFIILKLGWLDGLSNSLGITTKELFYSHNYRNSSFVFGIPDTLSKPGLLISLLVPPFMKNIPVLWILVPALVYGPLIYLAFGAVVDKAATKEQLKILFKRSTKGS